MKILEKFAVSVIVFLILYAFISIGLRMLELTSVYTAHMYGGIIATVAGIALLMYLLMRKTS